MCFLHTEPHINTIITTGVSCVLFTNQKVRYMSAFMGCCCSNFLLVCVQGPPGPAGLQGPIGAPGPAVSTTVLESMDETYLMDHM